VSRRRRRLSSEEREIQERWGHRTSSFWFPVDERRRRGTLPVEVSFEDGKKCIALMPARKIAGFVTGRTPLERVGHLEGFMPGVQIPVGYFSTLIRQKGEFRYENARQAIEDLRKRIFKLVPTHKAVDFASSVKRGLNMDALISLKTGKGDCIQKASLIVAICRANGFPARIVGNANFYGREHLIFGRKRGHWWAEVYDAKQNEWVAIDTVKSQVISNPRWRKGYARAQVCPEEIRLKPIAIVEPADRRGSKTPRGIRGRRLK